MKITIEIETVDPNPPDIGDLLTDISNGIHDIIKDFALVKIKPINITISKRLKAQRCPPL